MMKRLSVIFIALCLLFSCGRRDEGQQAMLVAKQSYLYLLSGDASSFVDASLREQAIPERYREQLILSAQMFMEHQDSIHGGISKIEPLQGVVNADGKTAEVYLRFVFADGQAEQVMVPMVKADGKWYLR